MEKKKPTRIDVGRAKIAIFERTGRRGTFHSCYVRGPVYFDKNQSEWKEGGFTRTDLTDLLLAVERVIAHIDGELEELEPNVVPKAA